MGTGPGNLEHMSQHAQEIIKSVDCIIGYKTYVDLVKPLISVQKIISSSMKKEVERVKLAIETALSNKSTALISSGDAGVYAMAGLTFEICKEMNITLVSGNNNVQTKKDLALKIEVIPGIPALCSGASLLGAPLTHDFAVISLSDLLTDWKLIEKRVEAAAKADFVIVFYNPKSKKRDWQLAKALEIISNYRDKKTPVGIVINAMRHDQKIQITDIKNLDLNIVNMTTTIFVGNSNTFSFDNFMVTPRGYSNKYNLKH